MHDKEIPKDIEIYPVKRNKNIDELISKWYNNGISKNNKFVR